MKFWAQLLSPEIFRPVLCSSWPPSSSGSPCTPSSSPFHQTKESRSPKAKVVVSILDNSLEKCPKTAGKCVKNRRQEPGVTVWAECPHLAFQPGAGRPGLEGCIAPHGQANNCQRQNSTPFNRRATQKTFEEIVRLGQNYQPTTKTLSVRIASNPFLVKLAWLFVVGNHAGGFWSASIQFKGCCIVHVAESYQSLSVAATDCSPAEAALVGCKKTKMLLTQPSSMSTHGNNSPPGSSKWLTLIFTSVAKQKQLFFIIR